MDSFACNGQTVDSVSEQRAHRTILWRQSLERQKTCTPSNLGCQLTVSSVKAYMASPVNPVGTKHLRANQRNSPTGNSTNQRANLHQIKWNFATTLNKAQEISTRKICLKSSRIEGEFHKIDQKHEKGKDTNKTPISLYSWGMCFKGWSGDLPPHPSTRNHSKKLLESRSRMMNGKSLKNPTKIKKKMPGDTRFATN